MQTNINYKIIRELKTSAQSKLHLFVTGWSWLVVERKLWE